MAARREPSFEVPHGAAIRTRPAAGAAAEKGSAVELYVSAGPALVDLVTLGDRADWSSGAGRLPFGGSDGDARGFALWRHGWPLEDNSAPARVLETHPEWIDNGHIAGEYTLPAPIEQGDRFISDVGFLAGAAGEVEFQVIALGGRIVRPRRAAAVTDSALDGGRKTVSVDLSPFAGADRLRLLTSAGPSSAQDWAVWIDTRIESP